MHRANAAHAGRHPNRGSPQGTQWGTAVAQRRWVEATPDRSRYATRRRCPHRSAPCGTAQAAPEHAAHEGQYSARKGVWERCKRRASGGARRTSLVCPDEQFYVLLRTRESHNSAHKLSGGQACGRVCGAGDHDDWKAEQAGEQHKRERQPTYVPTPTR